jgi:hypothetical protein
MTSEIAVATTTSASGNAVKRPKNNAAGSRYQTRACTDRRERGLFSGVLGDTAIVTVIYAAPFTKVVRAPGLPDINRPSAISMS